MILKRITLLACCLLFISCAVNGKHVYVDGKCVSCWNNPITGQAINYEANRPDFSTKKLNRVQNTNYTVLTWHELMLEGFSSIKNQDFHQFGADYLEYRLGLKTVALKNNEIAYKRAVDNHAQILKREVSEHKLKRIYQTTLPVELSRFDFTKREFPFRKTANLKLQGSNAYTRLPNNITVILDNVADLPNLTFSEQEAESFLQAREHSRGIYVRYIIAITKMQSPQVFHGNVLSLEFVDIKPSIITASKKESFPPFRTVKVISHD